MCQPELGGWQLGEDWLGESADPEVLAAKLTIEIVDNLQQEFPQLAPRLESWDRLIPSMEGPKMVGRPKSKAKHVQSLVDQQYALNDRLFAECPPMYLDGTDRRDPLAQSWRSAIEAVAQAWYAMDDLREVLAAKAEAAELRKADAVN